MLLGDLVKRLEPASEQRDLRARRMQMRWPRPRRCRCHRRLSAHDAPRAPCLPSFSIGRTPCRWQGGARMKLAILETGRPPGDLAEVRRLSLDVRPDARATSSRSRPSTSRPGICPNRGGARRLSDHRLARRSLRPAAVDRSAARFHSLGRGQQDGRHLLRPPDDGRGARRPCREIGEGLGRGAAPLFDCAPRAVDGQAGDVAVPASHQDQVVVQPPNTEIVASSAFTPYAALAWTDRPAISFQFHPEFAPPSRRR